MTSCSSQLRSFLSSTVLFVSSVYKYVILHTGEPLELSEEETEGWGKPDTMDSAL
jgi:hypothetical protein